MRPIRYPNLFHHNHQVLSITRSPFKPAPHRHVRLSSTTSAPNLLKTLDIPAPHLGHIRVLSLNNPPRRNAISRKMLAELSHEINTVKQEAEAEAAERATGSGAAIGQKTRVLILASELDDCFCAGADLKERKEMTPQDTTHFLRTLRSTLTALSSLPLPTISAVASVALGGGLELALATTFRVFASSAVVGLPETRLAIIPGAGGTYRLRRLIGEARAMEMVVTGRRVGGAEAGRVGLCERVVDVGGGPEWRWDARKGVLEEEGGMASRRAVLEGAVGMAREICEGGPVAVGAAMRAVREGTAVGEGREYEGVLGTGDRDEALRAFGEKRRAVFRGT